MSTDTTTESVLPDGLGDGHRPRGPRRAWPRNTKLFCGCANSFGDEPNTNVCPTCLGLPGSLPVVNEPGHRLRNAGSAGRSAAVEPGIFARKNYFYPDMPKDYQISQYEEPTNENGSLALPDGQVIGIERAHIEEDTGKSTHLGGGGRIHDAKATLVDYNRAGVPLVEIVSRPDMHDAEAARAYVAELRDILLATGVSDARMEEGSMRVDANVSVRPVGSDELRTRCEIKNINSLRSLGRAINYEARRHVDLWTNGEHPARKPATGTRTAGAPRRAAPRRTPRTTATSPVLTCRRSPRPPRTSPPSTPALPAMPAAPTCGACRSRPRACGRHRARGRARPRRTGVGCDRRRCRRPDGDEARRPEPRPRARAR